MVTLSVKLSVCLSFRGARMLVLKPASVLIAKLLGRRCNLPYEVFEKSGQVLVSQCCAVIGLFFFILFS